MINTQILNRVKLFSDLPPEQLNWLSVLCNMREFQKGAIVVNKDENSNDLMFLLQGQLVVTDVTQDGIEIGLYIIKPGYSFGEISAIDSLPRAATVKAMEKSIVGFLPGIEFQNLLLIAPKIASQLLKQFASTIRENNRQRIILSINNVHRRVAALLLSYSRPDSEQGGLVITNLPTQQELAAMANTTRESISRVLRSLIDNGILEKSGRVIRIIEAEKINKIINNSSVDFK
ncbi:Crp/Fnr family transcriptional regulator [Vogesella fluminis]|uniref:Crp/Fnr family transcriptional regulator n=1 Tax=Vogesella fluminis TaxID=1069161 RepID=A0ABQ3HEW2_9NEIS|nr:Crp/Fnr family transcriptional regulator [Vogesella fluminis]GHD78516.1 hypothetical protein GCM10011419_20680 [Vogesella fluminis]